MVSVERIYPYVREDKCNGGTLYKHMRHQLKHRKMQVSTNKMRIKERVSIDKRAEKVNNREVFGDWEADLIVGKEYKGAILTLTERKTKYLLIKHLLKGKKAYGVAQAINNLLLPFKHQTKSITMDNGKEFAKIMCLEINWK